MQQFLERHIANTIGLSKTQYTSGARKRAGYFVFNPYDMQLEETISSLSKPACLSVLPEQSKRGKKKADAHSKLASLGYVPVALRNISISTMERIVQLDATDFLRWRDNRKAMLYKT